ncbi:LysR family transcriptional regulator [Pseudomonas mucidolens]|uniref:DNA-binding transcriptional regulator, LysR family n=1 Tax=Pseudomonas mucidolens TaxID=46679 RepID=A0A1H2MX85_9PSED|nr:LysR family transcriptional regulator [Pseudomonas mucidolens]SDU97521.1 DNA-binding transcriptional regulator, LysR family [Pseudomonas mucidolens]SQH33090.1 putative HTH-type transcriptional regulator YbhD [Pseudomonas mucidolens]
MSTPLDPHPLPNVNLKLLQAFMLVAEHGSFRQAADLTHKSQSAVTSQIKQLESQLGVQLFHRTTRQVSLTASGVELLESAKRAVHEVERGLRRIQETTDLKRGRIFLACSTTVAATRLAKILAAFESDYPGIEVFVRELTSGDMHDSIRKGEVDFGIGPVSDLPDFNCETILTENLYALVPKKLHEAGGSTITMTDLAQMPLLLLNLATALRAVVDDTAKQLGLELKTRYQFNQAQTLISMANAGLGAAVLPAVVLPDDPHPDTHEMLIIEPELMRQVAIITIKGRSMSPAASRLAQLVRLLITAPHSIDRQRNRS